MGGELVSPERAFEARDSGRCNGLQHLLVVGGELRGGRSKALGLRDLHHLIGHAGMITNEHLPE
jgi:hypothetical protein